jgi:hypothetical protein
MASWAILFRSSASTISGSNSTSIGTAPMSTAWKFWDCRCVNQFAPAYRALELSAIYLHPSRTIVFRIRSIRAGSRRRPRSPDPRWLGATTRIIWRARGER